MSLFFITGVSGSGKSEILKELRRRGRKAYGVDEDAFAHWHNNQTGYVHPKSSVKSEQRTPQFIEEHTWKISRRMVEDLANHARREPVFLCGVAGNENEIWDLFSGVFALVIDETTLRRRLAERTENDFGKSAHEFKQILEWHHNAEKAYKKFGHITIDATKPIDQVADEILAKVKKISS